MIRSHCHGESAAFRLHVNLLRRYGEERRGAGLLDAARQAGAFVVADHDNTTALRGLGVLRCFEGEHIVLQRLLGHPVGLRAQMVTAGRSDFHLECSAGGIQAHLGRFDDEHVLAGLGHSHGRFADGALDGQGTFADRRVVICLYLDADLVRHKALGAYDAYPVLRRICHGHRKLYVVLDFDLVVAAFRRSRYRLRRDQHAASRQLLDGDGPRSVVGLQGHCRRTLVVSLVLRYGQSDGSAALRTRCGGHAAPGSAAGSRPTYRRTERHARRAAVGGELRGRIAVRSLSHRTCTRYRKSNARLHCRRIGRRGGRRSRLGLGVAVGRHQQQQHRKSRENADYFFHHN